MQCPNCGKTGRVTIGDKDYCTNCGSIINSEQPAPAAVVAPTEPAPVPTPAPTPALTPLPESVVVSPPEPAVEPPVQASPAAALHGGPSTNVLDLRSVEPVPVEPIPVEPVPLETPSVETPSQPAPVLINTAKAAGRADRAAEVGQSDLIQRFPRNQVAVTQVTPEPEPEPAPEPEPLAPLPTPVPPPAPVPEPVATPTIPPVVANAGSVDGLAASAASLAAVTPAPEPQPVMPPPALPAAVATQVDAMSKLVQSQAGDAEVAAVGPKPASVAALALGVALLGGYIWLKNYPNMALRVAASKAGVEAALPAYLPSSYNLNGPISYAPGQVSVQFTAPGGEPLTITQKRTNWDSQTLLENYVLKVSDKYLTVDSQGLTIYFYDQNQATWVNRGVWYTLEGDTRLSREQLLKIIDSL